MDEPFEGDLFPPHSPELKRQRTIEVETVKEPPAPMITSRPAALQPVLLIRGEVYDPLLEYRQVTTRTQLSFFTVMILILLERLKHWGNTTQIQ